jgi:hypothetical protein
LKSGTPIGAAACLKRLLVVRSSLAKLLSTQLVWAFGGLGAASYHLVLRAGC